MTKYDLSSIDLDKIVLVESEEDFSKLVSHQMFKFVCLGCLEKGKSVEDSIYVVRSFRPDRINSYKRFLCKQCGSEQNRLENHGDKRWNNLDKRRKTCSERYDVEHYSQSKEWQERVPEIVDNIRKTKNERYNDPNYNNPKQISATFSEHVSEDPLYWKKINAEKSAKCLIDRGVLHSSQDPSVKAKKEQTCKSLFNGPSPTCDPKVHQKQLDKMKELYGVKYYMQTLESIQNRNFEYIYDDLIFDSAYELCYYIYCRDNGYFITRCPCSYKYSFKGNVHYYIPDFLVNGQIVEIKSTRVLDKEKGIMTDEYGHNNDPEIQKEMNLLSQAKYEFAKSMGVVFLTEDDIELKTAIWYVKSTYGPYFTNLFRKVKNLNTKNFPHPFKNFIFTQILYNWYLKFHFSNNNFYGYTPFDIDKNSEYSDPCYTENGGLGLTPFDI